MTSLEAGLYPFSMEPNHDSTYSFKRCMKCSSLLRSHKIPALCSLLAFGMEVGSCKIWCRGWASPKLKPLKKNEQRCLKKMEGENEEKKINAISWIKNQALQAGWKQFSYFLGCSLKTSQLPQNRERTKSRFQNRAENDKCNLMFWDFFNYTGWSGFILPFSSNTTHTFKFIASLQWQAVAVASHNPVSRVEANARISGRGEPRLKRHQVKKVSFVLNVNRPFGTFDPSTIT